MKSPLSLSPRPLHPETLLRGHSVSIIVPQYSDEAAMCELSTKLESIGARVQVMPLAMTIR